MPKLRNGATDLEMFTQWIGRKCRNHNPLQELVMPASERKTMRNIYKQHVPAEVWMRGDKESTILYTVGDRAFEIEVREVSQESVAPHEKIAIGH